MATHTPGPWSMKIRAHREGECGPGIWITAPDHVTVVDTGAPDVFPLRDADARLILAAPGLLAACRMFVTVGVHHEWRRQFPELWESVQAAIHKAEPVRPPVC
jgi:hypothetical protein